MHSILFVCLANICRSPAAEALFSHHVKEKGDEHLFHIESKAISGWSIGEPADYRMQHAARKRGIEITGKSEPFTSHHFDQFDLILAADASVLEALRQMARDEKEMEKILLFTHFSKKYQNMDIPDPYYKGEEGFELVLDMIEELSENLHLHLIKKRERQ